MIYRIFIIPLLVIIIGFLMYKYPVKKPNWFIGYRSRRSVMDDRIWLMANKYCGKLLLRLGLIMVLISLLVISLVSLKIIVFSEILLVIIIICSVLLMVLAGVIVENKIKDITKD